MGPRGVFARAGGLDKKKESRSMLPAFSCCCAKGWRRAWSLASCWRRCARSVSARRRARLDRRGVATVASVMGGWPSTSLCGVCQYDLPDRLRDGHVPRCGGHPHDNDILDAAPPPHTEARDRREGYGGGSGFALGLLAFTMVGREGLEASVFALAFAFQTMASSG